MMFTLALTIFNGCQKKETALIGEQPQAVVKPDVYAENGHLVFKSKKIFDSLRVIIEKFDYLERINWENSLGFESATITKNIAEKEALELNDKEDKKNFKLKYSQNFNITENIDLRYKFYATGLEDILNIEGVVKIENSIYKFTNDEEYIIFSGDENKLQQIESGLKSAYVDDKDIFVFEPYKDKNKLKSTDILVGGTKTVSIRRLIYSLEKYVFSTIVGFDPYTGTATYKAGYELTLVMNQEKHHWYGWTNNEASYNIQNQYIDWSEIGVVPNPGYTGGFSDIYIGSTRNTIKLHYVSKTYYANTPIYYDFALSYFRATFWSSGIMEANKVTIDYYL
ncbi:hypothetical protein MNBD_BACTEROID01-172 [hydrothermal vent metagenome]|uniref:Uncharacterized protein n=1 Tax=hydrothermal vent metagenome TaxID=652676 RepID=A0A3B0TL02_9ZZZZ